MRRYEAAAVSCVIAACAPDASVGELELAATGGVVEGSADAEGALAVANTLDADVLAAEVGWRAAAANNVVAVRLGDDGLAGTDDDVEYGSLAQLDAVPFIGPPEFTKLVAFARAHGFVAGCLPRCEDEHRLVTCGGEVVVCPLGCTGAVGDAECGPIAVSNTRSDYLRQVYWPHADGTLVFPDASTVTISATSGRIVVDGAVVRNGWTGVSWDGIGFFPVRHQGANILNLGSLEIGRGATVRITGDVPFAIITRTQTVIRGVIDLSAAGTTEWGHPSLPGSAGGDGQDADCDQGSSGAGGGGFGTAGGRGADLPYLQFQVDGPGGWGTCAGGPPAIAYGGSGSGPHGNAALVPLAGGSSGGGVSLYAGWPYGHYEPYQSGGRGGGVLQLSSLGRIVIGGDPDRLAGVNASGGGGSGRTGGGSGGGILLEAPEIELLAGATLAANGGSAHGEDGRFGGSPAGTGCGAGGARDRSAQPGCGTGGGGGGEVGRIRINTASGYFVDHGAVISPSPRFGVLAPGS